MMGRGRYLVFGYLDPEGYFRIPRSTVRLSFWDATGFLSSTFKVHAGPSHELLPFVRESEVGAVVF